MAERNPDNLDYLVNEAKRIEEDALYSAKGHFQAASLWDRCHFWIGLPASIFAAVAGITAIKQHTTSAAVLAGLSAVATAVLTFLNPKERAAQHLRAGNAYKALNNDARFFHRVSCEKPSPSLQGDLKSLNERRNKLNIDSPQIPRWAFTSAREGIEGGEATYAVDKPAEQPPPTA